MLEISLKSLQLFFSKKQNWAKKILLRRGGGEFLNLNCLFMFLDEMKIVSPGTYIWLQVELRSWILDSANQGRKHLSTKRECSLILKSFKYVSVYSPLNKIEFVPLCLLQNKCTVRDCDCKRNVQVPLYVKIAMAMSDLQRYPWNFNLINNVEETFSKSFHFCEFLRCFL